MKDIRIGIIGTGMIGSTLASLWSKAGYQLFIGSRNTQNQMGLVKSLGAGTRIGSLTEAAEWAEVIFMSLPLFAIPELGNQIAQYTVGKILLDTSNPYPHRDGQAAEEIEKIGQGSGVWVAKHFPKAFVVKAFNTVYFDTLKKEAHRIVDPIGIPLASDNKEALIVASQLVTDAGFEPVITGDLSTAKEFDPGTPAFNTDITAMELRKLLGL